MVGVAELRERLLQEDEHFRRLSEEHGELEARLQELQSRRWLSDEDQLLEVQLKKQKLALKDEMQNILRGAVVS